MIGYLTRLLQNKELKALVENKTIVVKVGGSVIDKQRELLTDIVTLACAGANLVIVHGGGPAINKALAEQGVPTTKIAGMRITDDLALPVVSSVLSNISSEIASVLQASGLFAEGFSAPKKNILHVSKLLQPTASGELVDIGWVGEVTSVDKSLLAEAMAQGHIPVIAPLGIDSQGQVYNIHADHAAAAVASALKADYLLLVTDVPGVLASPSDPASVLHTVNHLVMKELMDTGVISGGMLPKLSSCVSALEHGVAQVHILDGHGDRPLAMALLAPGRWGTRIVRAA